MDLLVYHFVSGDALFSGAVVLLVAVALSCRPAFRGQGALVRCLSVGGAR